MIACGSLVLLIIKRENIEKCNFLDLLTSLDRHRWGDGEEYATQPIHQARAANWVLAFVQSNKSKEI
jgi:hypothetical protein